ncbi:uncharacterized protein LOC114936854 [Nylanderia fulva]|uniref:uncharacterized protein LOC114936854 n=1 Tax=Nylanderia fulva TaxID=613905 RepID=UPI0010FB383C|nr:uncharacterized protein LOC114936854 [Nylanderia fulva]
MAETDNTDNTMREQETLLRCFVCDIKIQGRFYNLPHCRTQYSKTKLIEKLGELVGERYVVVISEDDVICRSCAVLLNTFDRLETEIYPIRDKVLQCLEQKYSLEEGELRATDVWPKQFQPPQITKSNAKENTDKKKIEMETEVRRNNIDSEDNRIQKNINSWLQCNKCKYTTPLKSFMMYHLKHHVKQKTFCDKCGTCIFENQQTRHSCTRTIESENKENEKGEKTLQSTLPLAQITPLPLIGISSDHLYISSMLPTNNPTCSKQPISILQPVNMINIDMTKSSESNSVQEMEIKTKREETKSIFAFTKDGTMKLVKVPCSKET